jgi:hypothetical protein
LVPTYTNDEYIGDDVYDDDDDDDDVLGSARSH